jgi:NADH dehydrogenase (ubiquinone) Fe-S protein 6
MVMRRSLVAPRLPVRAAIGKGWRGVWKSFARAANAACMSTSPETIITVTPRVKCDGAGDISPALGHPRVWLQIDERGYAECGYCDRRFVLKGGVADQAAA